jgi:hypothetical protein
MYYTTVHKTSILANNLGVHLFELSYGFLLHARQQDGRTDARREERASGSKARDNSTAHSPVARPVFPRDEKELTSLATRPR